MDGTIMSGGDPIQPQASPLNSLLAIGTSGFFPFGSPQDMRERALVPRVPHSELLAHLAVVAQAGARVRE